MNARVYDLGPRPAARAEREQADLDQAARRRRDRLLDALFAAGLAWSAWRAHTRPRPYTPPNT